MTRSLTTRGTTTAELRVRQGHMTPTVKQLRLLELLSYGASYGEAGLVLGITVNSVKIHARRLYARLGANNAAHAVRVGLERGLLERGRWVHVTLPEEDDDEVDP